MRNMSFKQTKDFLGWMFPDLMIREMSMLGEGWDSKALLVNNRLIIRIPKRITVAQKMDTEIQLLQAIRPYLFSVQIPNIKWVGPPNRDLPVSAVVYQKIEGKPFSFVDQDKEKTHVFPKVGRFLSELHSVPKNVLQKTKAPWFRWTGDMGVQDIDGWEKGLREFTKRIRAYALPLLSESTANIVNKEINVFLNNKQNFSFDPVLLHGDLAEEHILVNKETGTIGIIDFGDSGLGDPAYDVWPQLTPYYSRKDVDETFETRQRFYRRLAPFHSVIYGSMTGDKEMVSKALKDIERRFVSAL